MFDSLTSSFGKIINRLIGSGKITEKHLEETLSEIRIALIDADVAITVVDEFIGNVKTKANGQEVLKSVTPSQMIIKIINDEMTQALSSPEQDQKINLNPKSLSCILMVGLQGSGKTTSTAKLAAFFKKENKKVLLISADTYRPAARDQLKILAEAVEVDFFQTSNDNPIEISKQGLAFALREKYDIAIFDTAGRLQIDAAMIREAQEIKHICNPCETLLVVDSLSGQNAFAVASEFDKALGVTGSILTRVDGDSRGGAILSVKHITQRPIKFLGTGEKTSALELFDAKRIAGRIIGMGDVVSLVEKAAETISKEEAEKVAERMKKGIFNLEDYLSQIRSLKQMGGISSVMKMMPGAAGMQDRINASGIGERFTHKQEAIILSMTKRERKNPNILNASRKNRIAKGSGASVADVQKLLKQFDQMQTMLKKASKMNLSSLMSKSGIGNLFS
jgi:signal recognition particle subunit SRP54